MKNLWLFDERRLMILKKLLGCDAAAGCDLRKCLNVKKTLLSYHLGVLRERGIIDEEKRGREKLYRIKRQRIPFVKKIVSAAG
jgi:DNA-binding transcriptional ArsR family regulator